MFHRAFSALIAAHFALYLTLVYGAGLAIVIYLISNNGWLLSAAYAGEIAGGFWAVQGGFALMEAKSKQRARSSRFID